MWFLQIPDLSRHFRTIVIDNRGVGRSDKPDEEYFVGLMASDAASCREPWGLEKPMWPVYQWEGISPRRWPSSSRIGLDRLVLLATTCGRRPEYLELTKRSWSETAAFRGLPPDDMIRKGMALAAAPGFAQEHPELIERGVRVRMETLQPLYAFNRQAAAAYNFDSKDRAHLIPIRH